MKLRPSPAPEQLPNGMVHHALGVHLNQRHDDYIKDEGLGYGAVVDLFLSAIEWWDGSHHNPLRDTSQDEEKSKAFARGTALHTRVLDGVKVYDRVYGVLPTRRSHPDHLDLVEDLKAACRGAGLSTHGRKEDLVATLLKAKADVKLLAVAQEKFRRSGKLPISEADDFRIKLLHQMMLRSRQQLKLEKGKLTIRQALAGGLKEVSVYWIDENGIRQRARFDILKPNFSGDLKSITKWKKHDFYKALLAEMIYRGYIVQAAHYRHARIALREAFAEGRVYGATEQQMKRLEEIVAADDWAWVNIFAKMDGAPQVKAVVISQQSGQFLRAEEQRNEALANFTYYRDFHGGLDKPWFDPEVVIEPEETDWPQFSVLGQ